MKGLCVLSADVLSRTRNILVVGDIHGDYLSFQHIHNLFNPRVDVLIFLGDYADRGAEGVEVIDGVGRLTRAYPQSVYALKGNHEDYTENGRPLFTPCTLIDEATIKRDGWMNYFEHAVRPFMEDLWLAVLIPAVVLFVHGGVSTKIQRINDLQCPRRVIEEDILWSDPFHGTGEHFNRRGAGVEFGQDVSHNVCRRLGVKRIVRSHQPRKAASTPSVEHDGRVITINSTTVYGGIPFILKLPAHNLNTSFNNLAVHVHPCARI